MQQLHSKINTVILMLVVIVSTADKQNPCQL